MSYGLDLVRLPAGIDPEEAYRRQMEEGKEWAGPSAGVDPGPVNPEKEAVKRRLAEALMARHPSLKLAQPDFEGYARLYSIDEAEARRRFRNLALDEGQYFIQVLLFDDTAGIVFNYPGPSLCRDAIRMIWHCLEILETQGGFSTYDPQVGKVLNLETDFPLVLETACGTRREG